MLIPGRTTVLRSMLTRLNLGENEIPLSPPHIFSLEKVKKVNVGRRTTKKSGAKKIFFYNILIFLFKSLTASCAELLLQFPCCTVLSFLFLWLPPLLGSLSKVFSCVREQQHFLQSQFIHKLETLLPQDLLGCLVTPHHRPCHHHPC